MEDLRGKKKIIIMRRRRRGIRIKEVGKRNLEAMKSKDDHQTTQDK